jgi:hypothetical protein
MLCEPCLADEVPNPEQSLLLKVAGQQAVRKHTGEEAADINVCRDRRLCGT